MKYRLMSCICIVLCATVCAQALAAGQTGSSLVADRHEFDEIASLVDQLRLGTGSSLVVHIGANNFDILKDVTTPITSTEARAARAELRKVRPGLPWVWFTKTHEIAAYDLDERTTIEVEIDTTPEKWIRRTLEPIATYPNSDWKRFIEFSLHNGLTELTVYEQGNARFGEITFAAVGPATCVYPGGSLRLSPAFYDSLRLSPDYPESRGTNGFVMLIQDPGLDIDGRFRLVSGLAALLGANSNVSFEYLVEGTFPEKHAGPRPGTQERAVSDGGLGDYLRRFSEPQRKRIVNSMLRQSLIDAPLACQLLRSREPQIHGMSIDDNRYVNESPVPYVEPAKIRAALKALAEIATSRDQTNRDSEESAARGMILEGVHMTTALYRADATNLVASQLIKHLERLKAGFGALGDVASEISKSLPEIQVHADALEKESAAYSAEAEKCRNALKRNKTMLPLIETAGRNSAKKVALVFTGSDQTASLTKQLQTDGIAYVVIEPRRSGPHNYSDRAQKRSENFLDDDADFNFKSPVKTGKSVCSLTVEQVRNEHIPFINSIVPDAIAGRNSSNSVTEAGNIDLSRLQLAVASNGWLLDSVVEIEKVNPRDGNNAGMPAGAFAFIDQLEGKPRLVLLDKDSESWREEDRYARLADGMFAAPYFSEGKTPVIRFMSHSGTGSTSLRYYSIYQIGSKRVYLVEGSISSAASVLGLSTVRGRGSVNLHLKLGDLLERRGWGPENTELAASDVKAPA